MGHLRPAPAAGGGGAALLVGLLPPSTELRGRVEFLQVEYGDEALQLLADDCVRARVDTVVVRGRADEPAVRELFEQVRTLAPQAARVLVTGDAAGPGAEALADLGVDDVWSMPQGAGVVDWLRSRLAELRGVRVSSGSSALPCGVQVDAGQWHPALHARREELARVIGSIVTVDAQAGAAASDLVGLKRWWRAYVTWQALGEQRCPVYLQPTALSPALTEACISALPVAVEPCVGETAEVLAEVPVRAACLPPPRLTNAPEVRIDRTLFRRGLTHLLRGMAGAAASGAGPRWQRPQATDEGVDLELEVPRTDAIARQHVPLLTDPFARLPGAALERWSHDLPLAEAAFRAQDVPFELRTDADTLRARLHLPRVVPAT